MRHEKGADLLRLARALAGTAEGLTLDEMAGELDVNRRTAERMRDALCGLFPVEAVQDGRLKRFRIVGGLDGFLQAPSADELAELETAARALDASGAPARAEKLRSIGAKIRAVLRADARRRIGPDLEALNEGQAVIVQAGPRPLADAATLASLRRAIVTRQFVRFEYRAANGWRASRRVAPYGILYGKAYYLVGPQDGRGEPVLWRLDRMRAVAIDEEATSFERPEFNLAEFAARSFGAFQEEQHDIVLRFGPSAAADARRFHFHPTQQVRALSDGSVEVRFRAGGLLELVRHLFTWGDAVEIVAPDRLRELMVSELNTALARHTVPVSSRIAETAG